MDPTRARAALFVFTAACAALPSPATGAANEPAPRSEINDLQYGGKGSDPLPLGKTSVRLRDAEIKLVQIPAQDGWQVSAEYQLVQEGPAPATVNVLLPEDLCPPKRRCSPTAGLLQDLGARFGDALLTATQAPREVVAPFAEHPGAGHQYALTLPPRKPTRLSLEYRFDQSHGSRYSGVFVTSAAGRFAGKVERVRYTIEVPQPMLYVLHPRGLRLAEFQERPAEEGAGAVVRLVLIGENLLQRSDLALIFSGDAIDGATPAGTCDGLRGDRDEAQLARILKGYSLARLRACRERLLSLHGYPFKDPEERARSYHTPSLPPWAEGKDLVLAPRPENPAYRESLLSPGEQAYLAAVQQAIAAHYKDDKRGKR